jgi:hypothetical protein
MLTLGSADPLAWVGAPQTPLDKLILRGCEQDNFELLVQ